MTPTRYDAHNLLMEQTQKLESVRLPFKVYLDLRTMGHAWKGPNRAFLSRGPVYSAELDIDQLCLDVKTVGYLHVHTQKHILPAVYDKNRKKYNVDIPPEYFISSMEPVEAAAYAYRNHVAVPLLSEDALAILKLHHPELAETHSIL